MKTINTEIIKKCADECKKCADECKDKPGMETCSKLCNECSDIATQCIINIQTNSVNKIQSLKACLKACEDCATECEKHGSIVCQKCAETCRACAKECKNAIEQKNRSWIWLFIGLILTIILLIFIIGFYKNNKNTELNTVETDPVEITDLEEATEINDTIAAYINFVENNKNMMSLDHGYTNEALIKLTKATNAKANEVGYEVKGDLEKVMEYAEMITRDPFETTHADNIRNATEILSNVLQNIQKAKYPNLAEEVRGLKSASASIKKEILTLNQKDAIKNYFSKASELLKKMK